MARKRMGNQSEMRWQILLAATRLFMENGYTNTSLRSIAAEAEVNIGSLMNLFPSKEEILEQLVEQVIESQFAVAQQMVWGKTSDRLMFYAAETALQLHIVESNEQLRDVYSWAYSLPKPSARIQQIMTEKLEGVFREHLPELKTQDFYKLEIASAGIMRGFMTIPCNMWFTMDQKIDSFLETTFLIYRVPEETIREATAFVRQFDFPTHVQKAMQLMLEELAGEEDPEPNGGNDNEK